MFTKGEWEAKSLFDRWHVEYDDFATICDIWAVGEEAEANAHLIAAAPDMYEALEHTVIALVNRLDDMDNLTQQEELLLIEARKALARASAQ